MPNNSLPEWAILAGADPKLGWEHGSTEMVGGTSWIELLVGRVEVTVYSTSEVGIIDERDNDVMVRFPSHKAAIVAAEAFIRGLKS